MPIRTLIVDDEPLARERITSLLHSEPDIKVVGECGDGTSAVRAIKTKSPDLVLLDIRLPELDGFEVLRSVPTAQVPAIIFVTAYDKFALQAFKVRAVDYVLKPVEDERLRDAIEQVRSRAYFSSQQMQRRLFELIHDLRERRVARNRIVVKADKDVLLLRSAEIDWVESAGSYVCFHVGPQSVISRETMNQVEANLRDFNFVRIHRSTIVNSDRIKKIKPSLYGEYSVELRDGTKLAISRSYKESVFKELGYT